MINIKLCNAGMSNTGFAVLLRTFSRHMSLRNIGTDGDISYTVRVCTDVDLKNGTYTVSSGEFGADIAGADDCSVFAAVGHWLLLCTFDGRGGFIPAKTNLNFTPKSSLRGMYLATHFNNFYHSAPIDKVYEVIEDLALKGCNSLLLWFDMHHYTGMDDPAAQKHAERLRSIIRYANDIGIGTSLTMLSNEGFSASPKDLRAEWDVKGRYTSSPNSHYHVELCPSKDGGIEEILKERREMLGYFKDLRIDYVCYWPYDQGGCTCMKCQPWGSNGFIKLLPHFRALVKEMMPETKIIVSTWYFDKFVQGEWNEFYEKLKNGDVGEFEYIMSFFFHGKMPECLEKNGVPNGVKFLDFPEISMYSCSPWGGFGASLLADFLQDTYNGSGRLYSGGYPYSEGIFEDANKFIQLSLYSGLFTNTHEALRYYVKYNFCVDGDELNELTQTLLDTERTLARERTPFDSGTLEVTISDAKMTGSIRATMEKYCSILPEKIREDYRFKLFYLRSIIDDEIRKCGGYPSRSDMCQRCMTEINEIYYANESTNRWVKAPVGR